MVAGGCVGIVAAGNVIYSKGHAALSVANAAFAHITLAIAPGGARGCARGSIAPSARDRGIRYRVMVGIMYGDCYGGGPFIALSGACSIQVADMHGSCYARSRRGCAGWGGARCRCASGCRDRPTPNAVGTARIGEVLSCDRHELPIVAGRMEG
jgi:hypothetical protein